VIRATRTHRLGTTGRNVVVGMIDTGHYAHPFFNYHGYRVLPVLLGPGAADPADDTYGHGTGESANIFAAAPDCRLRPVKGLVDPTGDFNVAMTSSPQPRVLTNSWGYNIDYPGVTLTPYLKTLEAAVANAIANGIVVCFSAGNGQLSFPASMTGVIAVGGVHVNYPNLDLEASSYASSFDSSLYPSRHVPDVCGITGRAVTIGGGDKAPSHMLPVQPGSTLDGIAPSTGASNDGWGLFSGTSAASPLVAGVVALLLEKNPALKPAEVKNILIMSAIDVTTGTTRTGDTAGPGWDAATGAGLVDAKWAWIITMGDVAAQFFEASPELQAEMLQNAQMPQVTREFTQDMIETLRSR
jgi:subtilisin family serine protease